MLPNLVVHKTLFFDCPMELVRSQFADVAHHSQSHIHPNICFTEIHYENDSTHFIQETKPFWFFLQRDKVIQKQEANGDLNWKFIEGPNRGARLLFRFKEEDNRTEVSAQFEMELKSWRRWLLPFWRKGVSLALDKAAREDRLDLEGGAYQRKVHQKT